MNTNYLSLNAELTTRISKISPYKAEDNFNEYYDAITKELIDACVEQGISESILTFIFHSEKILKRVVSDEAYLEILNEMRDGSDGGIWALRSQPHNAALYPLLCHTALTA